MLKPPWPSRMPSLGRTGPHAPKPSQSPEIRVAMDGGISFERRAEAEAALVWPPSMSPGIRGGPSLEAPKPRRLLPENSPEIKPTMSDNFAKSLSILD